VSLDDEFDGRSNTTTQEVVYTAAAGERNALVARYDGTRFYRLTDRVPITPGRGCTRPNPAQPTVARCQITADGGTSGITVNGRDGNDTVTVNGVGAVLLGGDGNDVLDGADFGNRFNGGRGNDTMRGGSSIDLFDEGGGPNGSDAISGGRGVDEVSYARRRGNVRADLQGDPDDGQRNERDRIGTDVEDLTGGRGRDRLTGSAADNSISGGRGTDIIKGGRGRDELAAQPDLFEPGRQRSRDRIDGGAGADTIGGSAGNNRIRGGAGPDAIYADRGRDRISDRDGQIDEIECGRGRDRVILDGFDFFADRCERVRRTFRPAGIPLGLSASDRRGGTAFLEIGCPRDAPRRCRGRAIIKDGPRTLGSDRFSIRRGRRGDAVMELPADTVGRLRAGGTIVDVTVRSRVRRGRIRVITAELELPAF
jgi:Ca2+-binding RTX toxin-like protein